MNIYGIYKRYRTDKVFRGRFALWRSAGVDVVYAVFRLITGFIYGSKWFVTLALYYLGLSVIRFTLIRSYDRVSKDREKYDIKFEYGRYRLSGIFLLILTLPLSGMAAQTVITNSSLHYPGLVIAASATYTFYIATMAIINVVRYREIGSPILSASKAITLATAAVSLFGLQTAMLSHFSGNDTAFKMIMNAATGGMVIAGVTALAIYMIITSTQKIKDLKEPIGNQIS